MLDIAYNSVVQVFIPYRNLTLVDLTRFKFRINNDICCGVAVGLLVLVHSAVGNSAARGIIRSSWGLPDIEGSVSFTSP